MTDPSEMLWVRILRAERKVLTDTGVTEGITRGALAARFANSDLVRQRLVPGDLVGGNADAFSVHRASDRQRTTALSEPEIVAAIIGGSVIGTATEAILVTAIGGGK